MSKDTNGDEVIGNCEYSFEDITSFDKKPIAQPDLEMPQASAGPSSSASHSRGKSPRIITIDSSSSDDDEGRAVDNGLPQTPCKKKNYKRLASSDSEEGSGGKRGRNRVRRHLRFSSDSDSSSISDSDSDKLSNADECK